MEKVWFLYIQNTVFGPFTTDEVKARLSQGVPENSFAWWKGQTEWIPAADFEEVLPRFLNSQNEQKNNREMWTFKKDGETFGPFELLEVVDILRNQMAFLDNILIRSSFDTEWKKVFLWQEITDLLGISRRINERVPLMGTVKVSLGDNVFSVGRTTTVSVGGIGIKDVKLDTRVGQIILLEIKSPDLTDIVRVQAEIRYKAQDGMLGVVFENPSAEAQSVIIDYIKKFKNGIERAA